MTWAQAGAAVDALAARFFAAGIRADDMVVIQLPNVVELPLTYLALLKLGAIVSPVPVQYGTYELSMVRDKLPASAFVTCGRLKDQQLCALHAEVFSQAGLSVLAFGNDLPTDVTQLELAGDIGDSASSDIDPHTGSANDIVSICWTSGTTGTPKGVPRSHNHWFVAGLASLSAVRMESTDRVLNPFPMVNMAGLGGFFVPWLIKGVYLVLHHPFDLAVYLGQIEKEAITYTIAAPAILTMLLKQPEILAHADLSTVRAIGSGSAPLTEWMVKSFETEHNIEVINIFGSNEGACLTSNAQDLPDPGDRARYFPRFGNSERSWQNPVAEMVQTRLRSLTDGQLVSVPGGEGELELYGATLFDGYWKSAEDNQKVFTDDGYFRTGDVFRIPEAPDKQDFYEFVGRSKDIIVRGGVNISPDELDNLLAGHPKLQAAAVVGIDDEIMGEKVGVAVVPRPGEAIELEDITGFLQDKGLAKFKLPEAMCEVKELPLNADIRARPLAERRALLNELLGHSMHFPISTEVSFTDWSKLEAAREESRAMGVEGLMLKSVSSSYGVGRVRGDWWKWKVQPLEIDAVLLYAQPGHGRRAGLHTDYTFALWDEDNQLVPVAKAYSGLDNKEIRELDKWIRDHTTDKFGPTCKL
eukprot:g16113.t1